MKLKNRFIWLAVALVAVLARFAVLHVGSRKSVETNAQSQPAKSSVVPSMLVGLPSNATGDQIAQRIHQLGRNISQDEQGVLAAWVGNPVGVTCSYSVKLYLINEVMGVLCSQSHPLSSLSDVLMAVGMDEKADPGVRGYALQHLVDWVEPEQTGEPCETRAAKQDQIVQSMLHIAGTSHDDLAGTAILGLDLILKGEAARSEKPDKNKPALTLSVGQLRPMAVALAIDSKGANASRITALQICGEHGFSEVLDNARSMARDKECAFGLRLSAIAAVGMLGDANDVDLLNELKAKGDVHLSKAVNLALKKVRGRDKSRDFAMAN